ncbi:hypothetical protein PHYBLDRAFT_186425 [Phycomyces blakesleeanus NRRL 1555(-)]|uniref:Protein EFR3 n=2 Tax=Phycomyces blakesleeanus TaxID=4837 RepID=A0A162UDT8_PHYB8|nr:hypothetical protein PHYBLDRAFT_186425 [Phycomyces blakesleeanus NRRL 1555(-)]OAD75502.1 hypothetical protein PHYBLDRAFT_186425 [Phycomyces blakesleeanus NRRL 1555(-)]|eukprot:XP_018293542.1 hypothetical protein PHYBLDRAFT_186425 [Phycomyces blakesleeanus NRRL 1555(-)]
MHLYVKHASLINNCYPDKEGEKGPRSSELSYLVFYATSRPVKLTKVGVFLEKKVERDIQKGKKQNNQVSLDIIKVLIEACHRDLNLFSKYVVRILNMVLDTKDVQLINLTCETFVVFANYHDGSTLGVDSELTVDYERLVQKFATFYDPSDNDDQQTTQLRYIGQRAMHAAVTSPALYASDFATQVELIMPPLITALANIGHPVDSTKTGPAPTNIHTGTVDKNTVDLLATNTFVLIFNKANGSAVRATLKPLFTFFDTNQKWWPSNLATSSMELVLDSLQPQFRYMLVSELLQQLESSKSGGENYMNEKSASIITTLDRLLNANIPLVGISVLEVLNSLFTHLVKSLSGHMSSSDTIAQQLDPNHNPDSEEMTIEYAVNHGLVHSIGGLASQIYYQNQLNDITGYIITKLRVGTALDQVDGLPVVQYRRIALKCLNLILSGTKQTAETDDHDNQAYPTSVSLDVWIPAFGLLTDRQSETRVDIADALIRYLDETSKNSDEEAELLSSSLDPFPKHMLNQHGDVMFVNALHQAIVDWAVVADCRVQDIKALYNLLCALTRRFGADGTIKAIPLIFKLQSLVQTGIVSSANSGGSASGAAACQRAAAALVVEWLDMIADFYGINRLKEYIDRIKRERILAREYSSVFLPETADRLAGVSSFEDVERGNTKTVECFVDRHLIVEIFSKDSPLRDEEDTHGLDLESKLYAEWGSEVFVSHERSFRIRTSRNMDDLKPKLTIPWSSTDYNASIFICTSCKDSFKNPKIMCSQLDKSRAVKVETLKEALSQSNSEKSDSQKDPIHTMTTLALSKRPKDNRKDMDSLLSALTFESTEDRSHSLVNPPYRG